MHVHRVERVSPSRGRKDGSLAELIALLLYLRPEFGGVIEALEVALA